MKEIIKNFKELTEDAYGYNGDVLDDVPIWQLAGAYLEAVKDMEMSEAELPKIVELFKEAAPDKFTEYLKDFYYSNFDEDVLYTLFK